MELENIVKIARLGKPQVAYFPSYVEYRPNTNASKIMEDRLH
jgi:hypothetical protein